MKTTFVTIVLFCSLTFVSVPHAADLSFKASGKDQQAELQFALDEAVSDGKLVLPKGEFIHSGVLIVSGVEVIGQGAATVLRGTTRNKSAVVVTGDGSILRNLRLANPSTVRSQDDYSAQVLVKNASNFKVTSLTINGSDSAGILVRLSNNGLIAKNSLTGTLADAIHITDNSYDVTAENNTISHSGDDGIAVVSYEKDKGKSHHIIIRNNKVTDNLWGRGITTVGGDNVVIHDNEIRCVIPTSGIYIASEKFWHTLGASNIQVRNNKIENCGQRKSGYDALMVYTNYNSNENVLFERNTIINPAEQGIWLKSRILNGNVSVTLIGNTITVSGSRP